MKAAHILIEFQDDDGLTFTTEQQFGRYDLKDPTIELSEDPGRNRALRALLKSVEKEHRDVQAWMGSPTRRMTEPPPTV